MSTVRCPATAAPARAAWSPEAAPAPAAPAVRRSTACRAARTAGRDVWFARRQRADRAAHARLHSRSGTTKHRRSSLHMVGQAAGCPIISPTVPSRGPRGYSQQCQQSKAMQATCCPCYALRPPGRPRTSWIADAARLPRVLGGVTWSTNSTCASYVYPPGGTTGPVPASPAREAGASRA